MKRCSSMLWKVAGTARASIRSAGSFWLVELRRSRLSVCSGSTKRPGRRSPRCGPRYLGQQRGTGRVLPERLTAGSRCGGFGAALDPAARITLRTRARSSGATCSGRTLTFRAERGRATPSDYRLGPGDGSSDIWGNERKPPRNLRGHRLLHGRWVVSERTDHRRGGAGFGLRTDLRGSRATVTSN